MPLPVTLIFDIGKTNKKMLLFNEQYQLVYEDAMQLEETNDEDGFPCEDIHLLTRWVKETFATIKADKRFTIKAVNCSAYGASFVHLDQQKQPFLPLYNYLKPYDKNLQKQFYNQYGGEEIIAEETASPVLGNLNSGMQLYRLKYEQPEQYANISYSLHLPQYISFILCNALCSDITSIGCHTNLWNFTKSNYHHWVYKENIEKKLAPVISCTEKAGLIDDAIPTGCGLHDSSAALIPYMASFNEPFILLSTGTWNISINPSNYNALTNEELKQDCLCYLSYRGDAIKASRLFAGYEHEQQVKKLSAHFNVSDDYYKTVLYDVAIYNNQSKVQPANQTENITLLLSQSSFHKRNLSDFKTFKEAYHQLMSDIIKHQVISTKLVMTDAPVNKLFVDGGFSKNDVFMNLLASAFPVMKVYSATVAQASALGAAIAIREACNNHHSSVDLIALKRYLPNYEIVF